MEYIITKIFTLAVKRSHLCFPCCVFQQNESVFLKTHTDQKGVFLMMEDISKKIKIRAAFLSVSLSESPSIRAPPPDFSQEHEDDRP